MFFQKPSGLLLLGVLPLLAWIVVRQLRRRRIEVSAFPALRVLLERLPLLDGSHVRRRKLEAALLLPSVALLALASGELTLGSPSASPLKVVVVIDHLAGWKAPGQGVADGWQAVLERTVGLVRDLRGDDRVLLVRSDTGTLPGGLRTPQAAVALLRGLPASELPPDLGRTAGLVRMLEGAHAPDALFVVTPDPSRWHSLRTAGSAPVTVLRAGDPPPTANLGILAVEMRPDLLRPQDVDLFCRVGAFAAEAASGSVEATVEVSSGGELLGRRSVRLEAGESRGLTFPGLRPRPGLLEVQLTPRDSFPGDNVYRAPVRDRAFLSATLVSAGNRALESALRALPGLEVATVRSVAEIRGALPAVAVFDNREPGGLRSNLLLVRPTRSSDDLIVRGDVQRPGTVEFETGEPMLEGVSLSGLTVAQVPVYLPGPAFRVVAKAGGYPLIMLGRNPLGRRVAVLGFDPVESGWHYDPSFPVLVANLVAWLGEEALGISASFVVGEELSEEILADAVEVVDPAGNVHARPSAGWVPFPLVLAGRYLLRPGSGAENLEVHANLLDEQVSRAMAPPAPAPDDRLPAAFFPRPFRLELGRPLLAVAILLLAIQSVLAPRRAHGRLRQ